MTFSTHFFTDTLSHISFYIGIAIEQQHHHQLHHYYADNDALPSFSSFKEKSQAKAANTSTPSLYDNDKDVLMLECGRKERYTVREAVCILLSEHQQEMKCSKTPLKARQNLSFLINVAKLKNWQDVKSNMNGVFSDMFRIGTWTVEVTEDNDVHILEKKKIDLVSEKAYHIYIKSMRNKAGLCCHIFATRWRRSKKKKYLATH